MAEYSSAEDLRKEVVNGTASYARLAGGSSCKDVQEKGKGTTSHARLARSFSMGAPRNAFSDGTTSYARLAVGLVLMHNSRVVNKGSLSDHGIVDGSLIVVSRRLFGCAMSFNDGARGGHDDNREAAEGCMPQWNGDPQTFLRFERLMEWWLEGEDTTYYSKNCISLAARFVRKQTGFARQKAEEYSPKELRGTDAELYTEETVRQDHGWAEDDDDDSQ